MRETTENKIESEIRDGGMEERRKQTENWKTAEETECDKVLHRLLAIGKKDDEIVKIFCDDLDNRPKFNKMIYVNAELCDKILEAWENCLDANISDHKEARRTNALPGEYPNDDLEDLATTIPF